MPSGPNLSPADENVRNQKPQAQHPRHGQDYFYNVLFNNVTAFHAHF
jgi:hypothetical protein